MSVFTLTKESIQYFRTQSSCRDPYNFVISSFGYVPLFLTLLLLNKPNSQLAQFSQKYVRAFLY